MSYPSYSSYVPATTRTTEELAGRGQRFLAVVINNLSYIPIVVLFVLSGAAVSPESGNISPLSMIFLMLTAIYTLALVCIQLYLLSANGQTIGKKVMGIRIIKQETGENGGFVTNFLLREFIPLLIGFVPLVGSLFGIVDILFIFREDQRCIHDLIAGTIVVQSDSNTSLGLR